MQKLSWFQKRVGKRIFRNDSGCKCHSCKNIVENGVIVHDMLHADYLASVQSEYFMDDKIDLNYRDKK